MADAPHGFAAVVLAAGASTRMGAANKLHLPIDGVPLLRRGVRVLLDSGIGEIVVVLGHERERTRRLVADLPVRTVDNDDYAAGQMTSVHRGLGALAAGHAGILIVLGDQPALEPADIGLLIDAFRGRDGGEVVIPTHAGERGNPIVVSERCRADILAGTRNLGCRRFIDNNPELVRMVEMPGPGVVIDLDTPEQYQRYLAAAATPGRPAHTATG